MRRYMCLQVATDSAARKLPISPAYPPTLYQTGFDKFAVRYGLQLKEGLSYAEAAAELGACIMHALACEGRLDNRTKAEARKAGDRYPILA